MKTMIVTETIVIYGMQFTRTYSDKGFYITCDDEEYSCAIDPVNSERQYAETEKKIESFTESTTALSILTGGDNGVTIQTAQNMRKLVEQGAESLDDKTVSTAPQVLPRLRGDGSLIKSGTRINWNGTVKRAAVDLWDTPENTPDAAPTLWEDIQYRQGYRIIPEVITPGQAFALGELGWWGDSLYKSLLNSNVWTPEGYPAGWEKQEG